jgi:hypothetical protein
MLSSHGRADLTEGVVEAQQWACVSSSSSSPTGQFMAVVLPGDLELAYHRKPISQNQGPKFSAATTSERITQPAPQYLQSAWVFPDSPG